MTQLKEQPKELNPNSPVSLAELLTRLREVNAQIDAVKPLYTESDALIAALIAQGFSECDLFDGTHCVLKDNFVDSKTGLAKNIAWKSCGIRRFEVDFTDALSAKRSRK